MWYCVNTLSMMQQQSTTAKSKSRTSTHRAARVAYSRHFHPTTSTPLEHINPSDQERAGPLPRQTQLQPRLLPQTTQSSQQPSHPTSSIPQGSKSGRESTMPPRKSTSSMPTDLDDSIQLSPENVTAEKTVTATEQQLKAQADAGISVEVSLYHSLVGVVYLVYGTIGCWVL